MATIDNNENLGAIGNPEGNLRRQKQKKPRPKDAPNLTMQEQINELKDEITRLRLEVEIWRNQCKTSNAALAKQIEELCELLLN